MSRLPVVSSLLTAAVAMLLAGPVLAQARTFIAVEVTDIAAAETWYSRTFDAAVASSFSRPAFEQRILRGEDVIVELVQRVPARPLTGEGSEIMKAGFVVDDLDDRVERWTAQGVTFLGRRIHDDALDLDVVMITDPDGNMIQIYGREEDQP
ncbi:MAG TPA: VOC family protein [Brevundimonas sp.]|nr:VOC family protein [Brevundimonas sp.]